MNDTPTDELISVSPADPMDEVGRFRCAGPDNVAGAVERAIAAFPAWRDAGFEARAAVLRRFAEACGAKRDELATLIAREVGKALWDARGEANLLPAKVDVTLSDGMKHVAPLEAAPNARTTVHPRGVLAVLGPFNFPAHLPNGHIVPALATGNCVVFKPSELSPAVGAWMRDRWREAGLPSGVLELVQGGAETGAALALDERVDGVLFTGSWRVGRELEERCLDQPGKLLALEMGGRNAMIVWEDADLRLAIAHAAQSMCATTGQRCSSLSRIFVHPSKLDAFCDGLIQVLGGLRIGAPLEDGVFMGPLASERAHARLLEFRAQTADAGGERIFDREIDLPAPYAAPGLVRFPTLTQSHPAQRDEIFAPEAAIYAVDDLDAAIAAVNDSDYGLAAAVVSRDRAVFEHAQGRIDTGILNWNHGTIGASGKLPFGGSRRSGNDRPAGILSGVYCTWHQAHLEGDGSFDPSTLPPGLPEPPT